MLTCAFVGRNLRRSRRARSAEDGEGERTVINMEFTAVGYDICTLRKGTSMAN